MGRRFSVDDRAGDPRVDGQSTETIGIVCIECATLSTKENDQYYQHVARD